MPASPKLLWFPILLSLGLASIGWGLKIGALPGANLLIGVGTVLVAGLSMRALMHLARLASLAVARPLSTLCIGLAMLSAFEFLGSLPEENRLALRLAGETMAAVGTLWLLITLNRRFDDQMRTFRPRARLG